VTINGQVIAPGDYVALITGAANRDPKYFDNPEELDIGREPNRHISFGRAAHFCLGAPLARVETQVAIGMFFEAFPHVKLIDPEIEWNPLISFRHLKSLRVDLGTGKQ
jgi:cytochrome P450